MPSCARAQDALEESGMMIAYILGLGATEIAILLGGFLCFATVIAAVVLIFVLSGRRNRDLRAENDRLKLEAENERLRKEIERRGGQK